MKFLTTKELNENEFLKYLIAGLLLFFVLFLISDVALHHLQIGLNFKEACSLILGNEEEFIEPILLETLLLTVHIDLFFSMLLLLCLTAISIRVFKRANPTFWFLNALYISAMLAPLLLISSYFLGEIVVMTWIVVFIIWHVLALFLSLKTLYAVFKL